MKRNKISTQNNSNAATELQNGPFVKGKVPLK